MTAPCKNYTVSEEDKIIWAANHRPLLTLFVISDTDVNYTETDPYFHTSHVRMITNIDPNIEFSSKANVNSCVYRVVKYDKHHPSIHNELTSLFHKIVDHPSMENTSDKEKIIITDKIWDYLNVLTDVRHEDVLHYLENVSQKQFEYTKDSRLFDLFTLAKSMLKLNLDIIEEKNQFENGFQYYLLAKEFEKKSKQKGINYSDFSFHVKPPLEEQDKYEQEKKLAVVIGTGLLGVGFVKYVFRFVDDTLRYYVKNRIDVLTPKSSPRQAQSKSSVKRSQSKSSVKRAQSKSSIKRSQSKSSTTRSSLKRTMKKVKPSRKPSTSSRKPSSRKPSHKPSSLSRVKKLAKFSNLLFRSKSKKINK